MRQIPLAGNMLGGQRATPPEKTGERRNLVSAIRRHPLVAFFVLTYALSWWVVPFGWEQFPFLATGPLLAALIVLALTEGRAGLQDLGSRMIRWRVGESMFFGQCCATGLSLRHSLQLDIFIEIPRLD